MAISAFSAPLRGTISYSCNIRVRYVSAGILAVLFGAGCGEKPTHGPAIEEVGVLRVLRPAAMVSGLPRSEGSGVREAALIRNFARDNNLEIRWIGVSPNLLAAALQEGRGDLAIGYRLEWIDADTELLFSRPVFNPLQTKAKELDSGEESKTVWAVSKRSRELLKTLDEFLAREHPGIKPEPCGGDLPEIKERGYIRVLTRNNPACYFIHRGQLMGFEYELVKQYAKREGLEVVMVVPPRWADLKQWMLEGRGDVVAACVTVSKEREKTAELEFCHPYSRFQEIIVTRKSDEKLKTLADLAGRIVHVRRLSHYWTSMEKLRKESGIDFELKAVPGTLETREILHRVESGEFDLAVADSGFLDIEINSGRKLRSAFMFRTPYNYGWVVRKDSPGLKASMDRFFEETVGTSDYNYLFRKYFSQGSTVREFQDEAPTLEKAVISPYDDLIRVSAAKHGFHWCLVAAQMFQESRFDPNAKSWSGALGLMQLMPATAKELGLNGRTILDPARNIDAGVEYLQKQRKRVPSEVDAFNRLCFALAAYNGGYGHLIDARALAGKLGRDPNLWVGNVDHAYALLSTPEYADKARYGYCRSEEIIGYVRKIVARYVAYKSEIERLAQTGQ